MASLYERGFVQVKGLVDGVHSLPSACMGGFLGFFSFLRRIFIPTKIPLCFNTPSEHSASTMSTIASENLLCDGFLYVWLRYATKPLFLRDLGFVV
jgi:hypothetical protein